MGRDSKISTLKQQLQTFTENTSLHGLRIVGESKAWTPRRVVWGVAFVFFLSLVIGQSVNLFSLALNPPTQTSIYNDADSVPIKLPALTICNENAERKSVINNESLNGLDYISRKKVVAHQLQGMVLECGTKLLKDVNCTQKFRQVLTDNGVCYTFNPDVVNPIHVDFSGSFAGWYFILNAEEHEYVYQQGISTGAVGFRMLVHRQETFPSVKDKGFSVAPGEATSITLTRSRVVMDPRMGCHDTARPSFRNPLKYLPHFTLHNCNMEQFVKQIEYMCGCTFEYLNGPKRICTFPNPKDTLCISRIIFDGYSNISRDTLFEWYSHCIPECNTLHHQVKLSHSRYPTSAAMEHIENTYRISMLNQSANIARVLFYYETETVPTTTISYTYDFSKLFGDLGGYMGLMMGASFLSLIEVVDMIGQCLHGLCSSAFKRTKPEETS